MDHLFGQEEFDPTFFDEEENAMNRMNDDMLNLIHALKKARPSPYPTYREEVCRRLEAEWHAYSTTSPYNRDLTDANSAAECIAEWDSDRDSTPAVVTGPRETVLALLETMPHTFRELAILSGMNGKQLNTCLAGLFREKLIHKCAGSYTYMLTSQLDTASGPSATEDLERQLNIDIPAVQTLAPGIEAVDYLKDGQRVTGYYSRELDEHGTLDGLMWLEGFLS